MVEKTSLNKKIKNMFKYTYLPIGVVALAILALIVYFFLPLKFVVEKNEGPTKIFFATNVSNAHQKVIDNFNNEYKDEIEVVPVDLSFGMFQTNDRKELLTRFLRSKSNRIDIFEVDVIWVKRFAKWCENLDGMVPQEKLNNILPHALETCYFNGELVAIPLYTDIGIMFCRRDILKQLDNYEEIKKELKESITWEKFISLSRKLPSPYYIFPADNYEGLVVSFIELILSQNKKFFEEKPIDLTRQESQRALKFLHDLINEYEVTPNDVTLFNEVTSYRYYLMEDGVFLRGWPMYEKDDKNLYQGGGKEKHLMKAAIPHFNDAAPTSVMGGWNIMVSEHTEKKEAISKFLNYVLEEEPQKLLYSEGGYLPILKKIYDDEKFLAQNPNLSYEEKLLKRGVSRPYSEDYTRISDIISHFLREALNDKIPVKKALEKATEYINSGKVLIK